MTTQAAARRIFPLSTPALASFLIAYGGAGVLLLAALTLAVAPALSGMESLARSGAQVESTLATTRDAFEGFGVSLVEGQRSALRAAATARSSAATARQLADGMAISIFGVQPLASLAASFRQQGTDLDALGEELDKLALSLRANEGDVRLLRNDVAALHESVRAMGRAGDTGAALLAPLAYLLIGWFGLQALGLVGLGLWLRLKRR
jgi:hypothetical protein